MRLGLIVEGGGVRAIYAAGVLDALLELNLPLSGVIGVSAGAIHGCSFVSKQKGRSLRLYRRFMNDYRFCSFKSFFKTGNIVDPHFCYHEIPTYLDPFDETAFENSGIRFFVGCSNLETGRAEYLELKNMFNDIDGLRASASLPYLSEIVKFRGMKLLDGGCTDRIPLKAFQSMGFDINIVVMTKPRTHKVKDADAWLAPLVYRNYPNFYKAFQASSIEYERTQRYIDEQEQLGKVFVIRPNQKMNLGRLSRNKDKIQRAYDMGLMDAGQKMPYLKNWLKEKGVLLRP